MEGGDCTIAIPSKPSSKRLATGTSRTGVAWSSPLKTRITFPSFFCKTKMSSGPRKAIVVGVDKSSTTVSTIKFESTTDGTPNTFCELSKTEKDAAKSTANRTLFNLFFTCLPLIPIMYLTV